MGAPSAAAKAGFQGPLPIGQGQEGTRGINKKKTTFLMEIGDFALALLGFYKMEIGAKIRVHPPPWARDVRALFCLLRQSHYSPEHTELCLGV